MSASSFRRLLAWQLAQGLSADTERLTRSLPDDFGTLGRQIDRAVRSALRAIEDGADARTPERRAATFLAARGEITELEASLDAYELLGLGPTGDLRDRAERIGALLSGLVERALAAAG